MTQKERDIAEIISNRRPQKKHSNLQTLVNRPVSKLPALGAFVLPLLMALMIGLLTQSWWLFGASVALGLVIALAVLRVRQKKSKAYTAVIWGEE